MTDINQFKNLLFKLAQYKVKKLFRSNSFAFSNSTVFHGSLKQNCSCKQNYKGKTKRAFMPVEAQALKLH